MKRMLWSFLLIFAASTLAMAQNTGAVKLEGQVVCCEDCWAKADRHTTPFGTRADLEKSAQCVANGDPSLLAVGNKDGGFTLYELQLGKYQRTGKDWLAYIGKRVEVTGAMGAKKGKPFIKVDTLTVLAPAIAESEPEINMVGTEVDLTLQDLFGVDQKLSALRGRIVVLNFWATYCIPCRKEMPDLAAIQSQFAALGVQVIGAAADSAADKPKVMRFIKEAKLNFPVWLGASAEDMAKFGLGSALPGTVIIGRDGKIVATYRGIIKAAEVHKQLETLLASAETEAKGQIAALPEKSSKASSVPS